MLQEEQLYLLPTLARNGKVHHNHSEATRRPFPFPPPRFPGEVLQEAEQAVHLLLRLQGAARNCQTLKLQGKSTVGVLLLR